MTHDDNQAIQSFGDDLIKQLKQMAAQSTIEAERTGIFMAYSLVTANLVRVQAEAIVDSLNKATVIVDAEEILRQGL